MQVLRIPVVFLGPFEPDFLSVNDVLRVLRGRFPGVDFRPYNVNSVNDAYAFLRAEGDEDSSCFPWAL